MRPVRPRAFNHIRIDVNADGRDMRRDYLQKPSRATTGFEHQVICAEVAEVLPVKRIGDPSRGGKLPQGLLLVGDHIHGAFRR